MQPKPNCNVHCIGITFSTTFEVELQTCLHHLATLVFNFCDLTMPTCSFHRRGGVSHYHGSMQPTMFNWSLDISVRATRVASGLNTNRGGWGQLDPPPPVWLPYETMSSCRPPIGPRFKTSKTTLLAPTFYIVVTLE